MQAKTDILKQKRQVHCFKVENKLYSTSSGEKFVSALDKMCGKLSSNCFQYFEAKP